MSNDAYEAFDASRKRTKNVGSLQAEAWCYVSSIAYSLAIIADEMVTARERRRELGLGEFSS